MVFQASVVTVRHVFEPYGADGGMYKENGAIFWPDELCTGPQHIY